MKYVIFSILATAALFAIGCTDAAKPPVAAQNSSNVNERFAKLSDQHGHSDKDIAPRISLADAKKDFDNKTAVFIDTHPKAQYDAEHIPGAINIQANMIKLEFDKVPKGKKIIAYCS